MRLSEKTLELTICSQISQQFGLRDAIWFGLTQRQEARFGFDACTKLNGRLLILQFKASNVLVQPKRFKRPRRRFTVPHAQLVSLQRLCLKFPRLVHYVLPDLGTTSELYRNRDIVGQSWCLDPSILPNPPSFPNNRAGNHYFYIDPPACEFRSEPFDIELKKIDESLLDEAGNTREVADWCHHHEFTFEGLKAYGVLW